MSEHTTASLARLDELIAIIKTQPSGSSSASLTEETDALRRAVSAFHLEAIRFRMFNVDRLIRQHGDDPSLRTALEAVRHELEAAGFHTRSHAS